MGLRADKARCAAAELTKAAVEDDAFGNLAESAIFRKYLLNELDKSFASAVYKGTLSWITNIDALIASVSFRDIDVTDPFVSAVLRNAVWQIMYSDRIPDHSAVDESVSVARSISGIGPASFVNAVLRKITSKKTELKSRYITDPVKYHLKCGLPPELAGYFKKWFGAERGFEIAASLHQNAEITIRVNRMISGIDEIMLELTEAGIEFEESEFIRDALIIQTGGRDISSLKGFRTGSFTVQDEAAMLASVIADPSEGDIVVDLCAAPGGKACHMGELMNNKGKIYAFDINPSRIRLIDENTQ
ncbi:MAG: transcription antitermination factor NusB, partial [Eubacteriales bacterium]|nr:transcription antitermination factor NusB [Eubacteriales bacterium]